ncbi:hypothetical protein PTT_09326 [Pyrenophora teres f. teres 0-1]|uniref:37S ribosomal protein mrp10, mitochondrial n=1 Tax=Pyrenophora teres f. teres (strain 0-1) TaxID=861557 RepID=E3RLR1_PYRTT|nr:hypothetical protein PTT_09326 [Pyrenophora teres f. teres 0-1]
MVPKPQGSAVHSATHRPLPPLPKLRVRRPNKPEMNPCLGAMSSVLGCWASSGYSVQGCALLEQKLRQCMDAPRNPNQKKNNINFHLSRMYPKISRQDQYHALRAAKQPSDWLEAIATSLVIDRQDKYLCFQAPVHYIGDFLFLCHACVDGDPIDWSFSTWFEYNRRLLFGTTSLEDLVKQVPTDFASPPPTLHRPPSHPMYQMNDKLDTFLSRFHDTARKKARRLMVTERGYVGVAPCRARPGDVVAVLLGCSIPLVLRKASQDAWQVVGEGFMYGYMNGEVVEQVKSGTVSVHRLRLV